MNLLPSTFGLIYSKELSLRQSQSCGNAETQPLPSFLGLHMIFLQVGLVSGLSG